VAVLPRNHHRGADVRLREYYRPQHDAAVAVATALGYGAYQVDKITARSIALVLETLYKGKGFLRQFPVPASPAPGKDGDRVRYTVAGVAVYKPVLAYPSLLPILRGGIALQ
jgi:hypothetical protein